MLYLKASVCIKWDNACKIIWLILKLWDFLALIYFDTTHMEKAMAPHSSTLAWKIPWAEEPGGLQSVELQRVWHDWVTSLSLFTFMHWRRKWQPTPVFLPGEPQGQGSLVGCIYGVAQSRTRLKCLSSSSIISHITILNESDSSSTYLSEMAWYNKNRIKRYRFSFDF